MKKWIAALLLCAVFPMMEAAADGQLLMDGAQSFRYLDDPHILEQLQGVEWTLPGFDDSGWQEGSGSFGAQNGKLDTVGGEWPDVLLRQYLDDGNDIPAYCLRTTFTYERGLQESYTVRMLVDDAAIVYLNGEAVAYINVPEDGYKGLLEYGAATYESDATAYEFSLDADKLAEGENVLAVELHQGSDDSSDIFFDLRYILADGALDPNVRSDSVCLGVGENEDEMLVTWQGRGRAGYVEVAESASAADPFAWRSSVFPAQAAYENEWGTTTFRARLTGLTPGRSYVYRVADEGISGVYGFRVPKKGNFSFLVTGDPQIADEGDARPVRLYDQLLTELADGDDMALLLTLGDQSDDAQRYETFLRYVGGAFSKKTPVAAIVGNHEDDGDVFSRFFYMPHVDGRFETGSGDMGGDYWFYRDGALFLGLNGNVSEVEPHERFMREAKTACEARYGEPDWIIAAIHHSLFSSGEHAKDESILKRRERLVPVFEEIGVDLVLSGHDHTYTRTYPMAGMECSADSKGIVYIAMGTSTGTKTYALCEDELPYAAVSMAVENPSAARVNVSRKKLEVEVAALTQEGTLEPVDSVTLKK